MVTSPLEQHPQPDHAAAVVSVSLDDAHRFSKPAASRIRLLEGLGVEGDAHAGVTVRHRYHVKKDPTAPNLTQVHLIPAELFDELAHRGFTVRPGEHGENVTTRGIDLTALPRGTRLHLGADAVVALTGLRNPCSLINGYQGGLMKQLIDTDADGRITRKAGVMSVVASGGTVEAGDTIRIELPEGERVPLDVV
ncbi:MOSC domain-containing protein [Cryobacterium breve]|uniref:MOSC domain-containing protein n=1 Tax=Cryobacterium breve TaxID=1259258 RepID=A0ABY7NFS8_9MICO|nr:MOSC domain-containing protein [Cryobacterium breve]WBM80832.1 MOSC domain-containing protein [Cryobacterium breve]